MAFNKENKIKWSEISPSLQAKFKELEDAVYDQMATAKNLQQGIRLSFGDTPPFNPKNNAEVWVDTQYRILRAFADNNWEFTRAAWYGGDSSGIQPPPVTDPNVPNVNIPTYQKTNHDYTYLTHTESASNVIHTYDSSLINYTEAGKTSVMYNFVGSGYINIKVTTAVNNDVPVGYLLGVTGSQGQYKENGTPYVWTIKKGFSLNQTMNFNSGDWFVFDLDSKGHTLVYIDPGDKPNDSLYNTTYFPADYPYRYPISTWNNTTSMPTTPARTYETLNGNFSVVITLRDTY